MRYNFGVTGTWFIGADLAWREGTAGLTANETGAAVTGGDGQILDAGRTRGAGKTTGWADRAAEDGHAVMFADAPLVVASETSQRLRETQAGQGYGRWNVSANTANVHSPRLAGMQFLRLAGLSGGGYSDGSGGSPRAGPARLGDLPVRHAGRRRGTGYDTERRRYKRKPPHVPAGPGRAERAANCDTLIERPGQLADAGPPLLPRSHRVTKDPAGQPPPVRDPACKHREGLIDALLRAWTASLWARHGLDRCQVLGLPAKPTGDPAATMIVLARPEQLLQPLLSAAEECDLRAHRECIFMPCIELPADQ